MSQGSTRARVVFSRECLAHVAWGAAIVIAVAERRAIRKVPLGGRAGCKQANPGILRGALDAAFSDVRAIGLGKAIGAAIGADSGSLGTKVQAASVALGRGGAARTKATEPGRQGFSDTDAELAITMPRMVDSSPRRLGR
jgi:hypothetical protein